MLSATQMDPTLQPKVEQADDLFIASFDRAIKTIDDDKLDEQDQSYQEQLSRKDLLATALRNLKNKVVEEVKDGLLKANLARNVAERAEKLTIILASQENNDVKLEAIKDFQQLTALFGFTASRSIWHKAAYTALGMLIGAVIGAAIGFVFGFILGFMIGLATGAKLGFGVAAAAAVSKAVTGAAYTAVAVAVGGAIAGSDDDYACKPQQEHQFSNELGEAVTIAAKSFIRTPGR